MPPTAPPCRTISVFAFRGDRSRQFTDRVRAVLDAEKDGQGPRLARIDCLLYFGHLGVSVDRGASIFGFSPYDVNIPTWDMIDRLRNGEAFPGIVQDDRAAFAAAGLAGISFEVVLPEPRFLRFLAALDSERRKSQYFYGFPNGDGDCNCTTWLERLGVPLLTGRMNELVGLRITASNRRRRFGACT